MANFAILHASDSHFGNRPNIIGFPELLSPEITNSDLVKKRKTHKGLLSTYSPDTADAFAALAHDIQDNYDLILITGDLAASGGKDDLNVSHAYVSTPPERGYLTKKRQPTLCASGKPIRLLPGNHDRFKGFPFLPGNTCFDALFTDFWGAGQGARELWRSEKDGEVLSVIGADFSLKSREDSTGVTGYLGQGRVYASCLESLCNLTRQTKTGVKPCAVLWAIHFDPCDESASSELLGATNLLEAAKQENIAAILCGHTHQKNHAKFKTIPIYTCGSTAIFAAKERHAQLIRLHIEQGKADDITVKHYLYDGMNFGCNDA